MPKLTIPAAGGAMPARRKPAVRGFYLILRDRPFLWTKDLPVRALTWHCNDNLSPLVRRQVAKIDKQIKEAEMVLRSIWSSPRANAALDLVHRLDKQRKALTYPLTTEGNGHA